MMGDELTALREFFAAGVELLTGTLAPGKGSWVGVLQGQWTTSDATEAVGGLMLPPGFYFELDRDGLPDVYVRDLEQGKFLSVMLRREPARVVEGA
jgi:hypothetical protein